MVKALLCKTYDSKKRNLKYIWRNVYNVNVRNGHIKLKLAKEKSTFAKSAGWGLQAVTDIPKKTIIGKFVIQQRLVDAPVIGTYCFKNGKKYSVSHPESLMNKINTIVDNDHKSKFNCRITNGHSVKTTKHVKAGEMLYAPYGVKKHYYDMQYMICSAKIQKDKRLRVGSRKANHENDNCCNRCSLAVSKGRMLHLCDMCKHAFCKACLSAKEKYIEKKYEYFFCKSCLEMPKMHVKYRNRFRKATPVLYNASFRDKEERWLSEATKEKYCTTFEGKYDLAPTWKCDKQNVINLFHRANMANVEFLNLKGADENSETPWDVKVVEALISMLERDKSHVYGINLGEIHFTQKALVYLHKQLKRTWIGWIFIESRYNELPKNCFRYTNSKSNLASNRKEKPQWYKNGTIAPWYDVENKKFLDRDETMAKCFFSSVNARCFGK